MRIWEILWPQFWLLTMAPKRRLWHPRVYPTHLNVSMRSSRSGRHPWSRSATGDSLTFTCSCNVSVHWRRTIKLANQWEGLVALSPTKKRRTHRDLRSSEKLKIRFRRCVWKSRMCNWYGYAVWAQVAAWIQQVLLMIKIFSENGLVILDVFSKQFML